MEILNEFSSGAYFVRADLHIHSFGFDDGSFDVTDETMTPENIVDTAIENNLSIISITDHNEINNSKKAIDYSKDKEILVIPGIEISTTQGHLLVYFEKFSELRNFYGKLSISEDKESCLQGIVECLDLATAVGGIGVLAHIELDSGFEKFIGRFSRAITDIFTHSSLYALEICKKDSANFYTDLDDSSDRKTLVKARRRELNLPIDSILPKLMSSDSHRLDKLGINVEGDKRLTRIKVDTLTFSAFKNALISYESRIRLEEFIPDAIPYIVGISIKGGLLDSQTIRLSKNLTCIIGGRGTGKSTLLESIREASGNKSNVKIVDSEVWPDEINLLFEDETGKQFHFRREKNSNTNNISDTTDGLNQITIESYGQGETAETIQHSDTNPKVLLDFLDGFIDVSMLLADDESIREQLLNNQSELSKARIEIKRIPDIESQITVLIGKQKRLEKDKVGDLVKYQSSLIAEKNIRTNLIQDLRSLVEKYKDVLSDDETFEFFSNMSDENIIVGKDEFSKVKEIISEFSQIVSSKSKELDNSLHEKIEELKVELKSWKSKEADIQRTIDEKKKELEAQGIPFDIGKINQIANDLEHYKTQLRKLKDTEKNVLRLEKGRKILIKERKSIKSSIYNQRYAFSTKINKNLKNAVSGLLVSAKYKEGCYSPDFEDAIKQLMDWRTSQVPKSCLIAENMSPLHFSDCIKKKDLSELKNINNTDGVRIFSDSDISRILEKSLQNNIYEDFESLKYDDKPKLTVTKILVNESGENIRHTRSLANLSLGQQQSILLAILLQSKSTNPLLIDQPEDNLDSEFIYKTIVDNLRKIKEKRQIIIVTHNPNIAVLGDAELIIPLRSTSIKTHITDRGSIDHQKIRDLCCSILEGGEQAFTSRQKLYGIKS